MDIYSFVNSKDIRQHLRDINYQFNSLEAAWLIFQCRRLCFEEKKEAWFELIETMEDCKVPKRDNCNAWDSLHEMIHSYINAVEKIVDEFYRDNGTGEYVYMYSYYNEGDRDWVEYDIVYPSLEKCLAAFKKEIEGDESKIKAYRIKKQSLFKPYTEEQATYDVGNIIELQYRGDGQFDEYMRCHRDLIDEVITSSFEGMWFNFPTPFKKGDIVCTPKGSRIYVDEDIPFVLEKLVTWDCNEFVKNDGDNTDMLAYGWVTDEDGRVWHTDVDDYMDLEYYHGSYDKNKKMLLVLNKYFNNELPLDYMLHAYLRLLSDIKSDDLRKGGNAYTEDVLKDIT